MAELVVPTSAAELYLYRGAEVRACRPVMTGDVFADIEIPGVDDGPGLGAVLAHPCSMRDGPHLRDRLMMCRVAERTSIPLAKWADGHYGVMPLPDLYGTPSLGYRAIFDLAGRVATDDLSLSNRVACLEERGVALLLQRLVFSYTRAPIDADTIHESVAHLLAEAELLEEWVEARTECVDTEPDADAIRAAEAEFDALMSKADELGVTNRSKLRDPATRASVRRLVAQALRP
jgi:hypothetical protein